MSEIGRELSNFQNAMPVTKLGLALRRRVLGSSKFDCGVRVVEGDVPGQRTRWRHRRTYVDGDVLHHGSSALRLVLLQQVPNPGGFNVSVRCVVWRARVVNDGAIVELGFVPRDAPALLKSDLAAGRSLRLDLDIDAL